MGPFEVLLCSVFCQNLQRGKSALRPTPRPGRPQPFPGKKLLWDSPPSGLSPGPSRVSRSPLQRFRVLLGIKLLHNPNLSFPAWQVPANACPVGATPLHLADKLKSAPVMGLHASLKAARPAWQSQFARADARKHTPSHSPPQETRKFPKTDRSVSRGQSQRWDNWRTPKKNECN